MGERHNALLIQGDSPQTGFQVRGFQLQQNVGLQRIVRRQRTAAKTWIANRRWAPTRRVIVSIAGECTSCCEPREAASCELQRESTATREQYGQSMVGQSLLMARRLVEAGVSLVTVNWEDETKTDGVNTCWDTHQDNFPKLKKLLCPLLDRAFPALLEDLQQRGLLESTLVVAVGEFGRTPHMGQFSQSSNTRKTGRDHWPSTFTALVGGGGTPGGHVYGATDYIWAPRSASGRSAPRTFRPPSCNTWAFPRRRSTATKSKASSIHSAQASPSISPARARRKWQ